MCVLQFQQKSELVSGPSSLDNAVDGSQIIVHRESLPSARIPFVFQRLDGQVRASKADNMSAAFSLYALNVRQIRVILKEWR